SRDWRSDVCSNPATPTNTPFRVPPGTRKSPGASGAFSWPFCCPGPVVARAGQAGGRLAGSGPAVRRQPPADDAPGGNSVAGRLRRGSAAGGRAGAPLLAALRHVPAPGELGEHLFERKRLREDVEHAATLEGGSHDVLVEPRRNVDAAVGDAVVLGCRRGEASRPPLGGYSGRRRMHRDRGIVVDPQYAAGVDRRTESADEAARRRGAIAAGDLAQRESGDARRGVVADRRTEQSGSRATEPPVAPEHQDLGGLLVH